jgi:hypothetical protein
MLISGSSTDSPRSLSCGKAKLSLVRVNGFAVFVTVVDLAALWVLLAYPARTPLSAKPNRVLRGTSN